MVLSSWRVPANVFHAAISNLTMASHIHNTLISLIRSLNRYLVRCGVSEVEQDLLVTREMAGECRQRMGKFGIFCTHIVIPVDVLLDLKSEFLFAHMVLCCRDLALINSGVLAGKCFGHGCEDGSRKFF